MKRVLDCAVRIAIRLGHSSSMQTGDVAVMLAHGQHQSHVN